MRKQVLLIGCLILLFDFSFAQTAPGIEWQNTIGGSGSELLLSIQQTTDGGYVLGGYSISGISGDKTENGIGFFDYWIVKSDSSGVIQWQNTIGGSDRDELYTIQQTVDGGYILGGNSGSGISGDKTESNWDTSCSSFCTHDYWIVKTDVLGNIQWQNTIGGDQQDYLYSIQQTSDGGYILGGWSSSNISGDKTENSNGNFDYWIVKTDGLGNIQWQNSIGGNSNELLYSILQTNDGGYVLGGFSSSNISGDKTENCIGQDDYWIVKTDSFGNIQWQNTIGGNSSDQLYSIIQTADGGYILAGSSNSNISGDKTENSNGAYDYWIVKTDSSGNIQGQNTIGGSGQDMLRSVRQTADGECLLGGWSFSNISGDKTENNNGNDDYWVVKTDVWGNIKWQNTIGGDNWDELYSIQQSADGGYILAGSSESQMSGDKTENCIGDFDYWIIKLFPDTITGIIQHPNQTTNIQISPNPFTTTLTLKGTTQKGELVIFDVTGKEILHTKTFSEETKINTAHLTPGFYFINYREGERSVNKKVVKLN